MDLMKDVRSGRVLKGLMCLLGLLVIFLLGMGAGAHIRQRIGGDGEKGRFMYKGMNGGMFGQNRVFGIITAIKGNQITITDNAGQPETVVTSANTVITNSAGTETGLASLKAGQSITVAGSMNASNQLQANAISVK